MVPKLLALGTRDFRSKAELGVGDGGLPIASSRLITYKAALTALVALGRFSLGQQCKYRVMLIPDLCLKSKMLYKIEVSESPLYDMLRFSPLNILAAEF